MRRRKQLLLLGIALVFAFGIVAGRQLAKMGNTGSASDPDATLSYSLEDVYDRLDSGVVNPQDTFAEPTVPPGTGTMHTIDDVMALIPDHKPSFSGTDGTKVVSIPDGIYEGDQTVTAVDADLVASNIRSGVQIFDVTGSNETCVVCEGALSAKGRWCDNGDGTVTDMTNGLLWLKDASWGGQYPWRGLDESGANDRFRDAHWRASRYGVPWRLPTELEMAHLYLDPEGISRGDSVFFENIQDGVYWAATSDDAVDNVTAWGVDFSPVQPASARYVKTEAHYVWPVHGRLP